MKRLHFLFIAIAGTVLVANGAEVAMAAEVGSEAALVTAGATGGTTQAGVTERTVTLMVDNMFCASCPYIVKRALERTPGVIAVKVHFRDKMAVVTYDPTVTGVSKLTAATFGVGFPSEVIGD